MKDWIKERETKLRKYFDLDSETEIVSPEAVESFNGSEKIARHFAHFNIEWYIIPSEESVSVLNESYGKRLYSQIKRVVNPHEYKKTSSYRAILSGHGRHQGKIVGIETTMKPRYLPGNNQQYSTPYGYEPGDPFAPYFGRAGFASGSRYGHNYRDLRKFVNYVNEDWKSRGLMPEGFHLTICPPVIFNLIGTIFHPEWSATESLELGFYRDENDNANCYLVGSNAPNDFSYIEEIDTASDWTYLGFRMAIVPD
ncbi:hypothetical protein BH10ACI1_BH10ACI1_06390 [soil metagenome]